MKDQLEESSTALVNMEAVNMNKDQLEESSTALAGGSEHEGPTRGEFHCSSWRQ